MPDTASTYWILERWKRWWRRKGCGSGGVDMTSRKQKLKA